MLVSRLPPLARRSAWCVGQLLMLYITWLLFEGSWTQTRINWDVEAPVTGVSMAIFYAVGRGVRGARRGVLLLRRPVARAHRPAHATPSW